MSRRDLLALSGDEIAGCTTDLFTRHLGLPSLPPRRRRRAADGRGAVQERAAVEALLGWLAGGLPVPGVDLPSLAATCEAAGTVEAALLAVRGFGPRASTASACFAD